MELELLGAVFSPHCSSSCTPITAHSKTPLSSSWSLQMTPHWLASAVNNCLVHLSYQIWPSKTTEGSPDCWSNHWYKPLVRIIGTLFMICTYPEWAKGLVKSLWTPHIQHTLSLNCYHLEDATELWAPEWPDTETVSSLMQSISWTLDIKRGTHNTIIHYTYLFFISNLHISDHIIVYIIYCVFANLYIAYLYIILLSPVSCRCCTVELLSLLQIHCMCKHTWPINLILMFRKRALSY